MVKIINSIDEKTTIINIEFKETTLEELFNEFKIDKTYVGAVLVNGVPKRLSYSISDNSEIHILPLLGGG